MIEAASTSETSVNFYQTSWCYNPEENNLHRSQKFNTVNTKHITLFEPTGFTFYLQVFSISVFALRTVWCENLLRVTYIGCVKLCK
jgi:hypothetical protein